MKKFMILLLLVVHVLGKNPVPDDPYPDHIEEKIIYNPSIPTSQSGGTTILKSNDYRVVKVVDFLIYHINSKIKDDGNILKVQKTGKVKLKVIDDYQHMPHQRPCFIKNIYTFEKIMCISKNGHSEVNLHGSLSITYDPDENFVKHYIFVNCVISNSPIPYKERVRRKSMSGDINDGKKNQNGQRRHSLKLEVDRHRNRRMNN